MKMKNSEPFVLKVVDKCVKPFLSKDLNYSQVREMLRLKLIMDSRRVSQALQNNGKKIGKEPKKSMILTCLVYMGLGIFIASMQVMPNMFGANTISFAMLIFMLFSVYISEYSAVLLDTTEKSFYGALPIGKNEISTAKNIHIAYYIGTIAAAMMLPSMVVGFISKGILYGLAFTLVSIVIVVVCLHLAGVIYYLLLKIFSGEKLKDILSGFQIFMTIAIVLSYQIVPRVISIAGFSKGQITYSPFYFLLPSAWFSAILESLFGAGGEWYIYVLAGITVPAVILLEVLYKKKVMPEFEGELDKLTETAKENKSLSPFSKLMCKLLSKDEQENAFMKLVLIQVSRNRDMKLKLYPQLANVFILPIIMVLPQITGEKGLTGFIENLRAGRWGLALLYFTGLTSASIYMIIGQTENPESIMFYQILPIENLSKCIRAGVKVVLFRYLTPIFVALSALLVGVYGFGVIPDIILAYLSFIFVTGFIIRISAWMLPFSYESDAASAGNNLLMFFISLFVFAAFGWVHIFWLKTLGLQLIGIAVMILANLVLWKFFMNKKYVIARG